MKKGLILTMVAAAIMGMGTSRLHAETAQVSPQGGNHEMISMCIFEVNLQAWQTCAQDIFDFVEAAPKSEWEEDRTERPYYYNIAYSKDGKYIYDMIVHPFSPRYAGVVIRVFGEKKSPNDNNFVAPDTSNKTMAGMCTFELFPNKNHEEWEGELATACNVLGIDVVETEWEKHETEYTPVYSKKGFDAKGKNMYDIYVVPPIDEGDLCSVAIMKWVL